MYARVRVSDTGAGIPPDVIEHIFEPFFTTKGESRGTGLGLSTVYGLVRQQQGHIEVESQADAGTTFTWYLPLHQGTGAVEEQRTAMPSVGAGETVLVFENNEAIRTFIATALRRANYRVLTASGSDEAVRLFHTDPEGVALLLADLNLPHLNGWEVYGRLQERSPRLRVLFCSGWADEREHRIHEQGLPLLRKPVTVNELLRAVHEALHGS